MAKTKKRLTGNRGEDLRRKSSPEDTVGSGGTVVVGGFVQTKEKNSNLTDRQKYITYSDILLNTSIVGAGVRYFLNLVAKSTWKSLPANDTKEAKDMAEFVDDVISKTVTPWSQIVRRAAMYRFYGFSVQEWTALRREDGRIGLLDIEARPQHTIWRWDVDEHGRVNGCVQLNPTTSVETYLGRDEIVYIHDQALTDDPEGIGIFRHIAEPAETLKRYQQLEGFGYETDLRGVPIGRAPLTQLKKQVKQGIITNADYNTLVDPLRKFISGHIKNPKLGMLMDSSIYRAEDNRAAPSSTSMWNIELMKGGSTGFAEVAEAINRLNHEIARLMGVEHLLLGGDGRGTQALSQDKSNNFSLIISSTLTELAEMFQKDIVDRLWELNGLDQDIKPKFATEAVQFRSIEEITGALKDLAQAGAPLAMDDPAINEIRQLLGLSKADFSKLMADMLPRTVNQQGNPDDKTTETGGEKNGSNSRD